MAINKKLITFDKKATFLGANGINNVTTSTDGYYHNIPEWSMVFILETGEIWHNGVYFGKPIKDLIVAATSQTTKGLVFTSNGSDYYYKTFNLWGNTFDGSLVNINGELLVQGASHKWVYGDAAIKKNNTNLIAFSNDANNYKVYIPNGDLLVTGGDINVNNGKVVLDSTGYIQGTHLLNTNAYFNLEFTLGKTWNSIKLFNTSGTQISLDSTRPAIINIQAHSLALNTQWQPWIAGGDMIEQSSWGIGLGGDAFYIGRIAKSHTENSLSQYWKFSDGDGLCISGTTKYIKVLGVDSPATKFFMADGTLKDLSTINTAAVPILGTSSATTNATTDTSNTTTYLNIILNSAKSGGVKITGSGGASVKAKDGVLTITSTWAAFTAATENAAGVAGYITPPAYADRMKFFRGDNTWLTIDLNVTSSLYVGASNGTENSAQSTNGNVYLIFAEGSSYSRYKIVGSGRASVTSDANGNITIDSSGYSNFGVATDTAAGTSGLVPAPSVNQLGSAGYFLRADLTWAIPTNTWKEVTTSDEGYLTKIVTTNTVAESDAPYIYVYKSGVQNSTKGMWVPLPTTAFHDTWTAWVGATDLANGTPGYMPAPTSAQKDLFLKGDGTWVALNNYELSAATSSALGGVKVGTTLTDDTDYVKVHIKDDFIYYKDTTYSFSNLKFQQEAGTDLMTYNSQAVRTIVAGTNITFTHDSNVLTIAAATYSNFTAATATKAGKSGLVPGPGANILGSDGYYLRADGTWAKPVDENTWRGIYVDGTSKLGTGTNTKPINFKAAGGVTLTFTAAGNNAYNTLEIKSDTYTTFVKSGTAAAAGLVPKPPTTEGTTKFLREDGTWEVPSYPTLYNLVFNNGTNDVLTYDPDGSATKKIIKGDNITFTVDGNNITIAATNTWTAMTGATSSANGKVGYINAAPPKDGYNTKFWRADGTWAVPTNTWKAANTAQEGYVPKLVTGGGTIGTQSTEYVLTFVSGGSGTIAPVWKLLPADAFNNTWTANALNTAGYVAAPTKAANANMTWLTDAEGVPAWRASNNHTHSYLPLSGGTMTGSILFGLHGTDNYTISGIWTRANVGLEVETPRKTNASDAEILPFNVKTRGGQYAPLYAANIYSNNTQVSVQGHKHAYTDLTGSGTTANQAIVSNGTANGWTLKTLGSNAFNSTSYLPLSGGTMTGNISMNNSSSITNLPINGGIYWNPYVESASDGSDAASITLIKSGPAGGTTLVLTQQNDAADTIQFVTDGSANLYHNSNKIWDAGNDGHNSGLDADLLDGYHATSFVKIGGDLRFTQYQQGTWTRILQFTISSRSYQSSISFRWHPTECARDIWADFNINIRDNDIAFYSVYHGTNTRTLKCVGDGTTFSVWVSGIKDDWDPFGLIQLISTCAINSYNFTVAFQDSEPSGTYNKKASLTGRVAYATNAGSVTWSNISSKPEAIGSATQPVYWNGSGFTLANAYPTKSSWNYDDVYVKKVGDTMTGRLVIKRTNTNNGGHVLINDVTTSNSYVRVIEYFAPNIGVGGEPNIYIGQSDTARNGGYIGFKYNGNGSISNFIGIGLHSADNVLNVVGTGNVGIGTTSPSYKLHVAGTFYASGASTIGGTLKLTNSNDVAGTSWNSPALCVGGNYDAAHIEMDSNEIMAKSNASTPSDLYLNSEGGSVFMNNICVTGGNEINCGSSGGLHLQYRVSQGLFLCMGGGNVGIGDANPAYKLEIAGTVGATNYYIRSDRKLKKNIQSIDTQSLECLFDVSDKLLKKFTWKQTGKDSYGFIAQELEEYIPEAVNHDKVKDIKSVQYDVAYAKIIASLIYKVKDLENRIKQLENHG